MKPATRLHKRREASSGKAVFPFSKRLILLLLALMATAVSGLAQTTLPLAARVNHAPAINGTVTGSVQQMLGENFNLNSNAVITGDLYVPGVPTVQQNGSSQFQGIQLGTGAATPTGYYVTLNHNSQMRYLIERTNPVTFAAVPNPPTPTGTRDVSVNSASTASSTIGNWSTVHNLTLNSNAGTITVPAGSYGAFTANVATGFILGTAGATTPSTYSFDSLNLNSSSSIVVNGPVIIRVKNGVNLNSSSFLGNQQNPSWVSLKITTGGLNINSNGLLYGFVEAPTSTVNINFGKLVGSVISASNLNINSSGSIQGMSAAQPPTVSITSPVNGQVIQQYVATTLQATASDPQGQGTITKVDFYENNGSGAVKIGTSTTSPYNVTWSPPPGTYTLTAVATDSLGLTATSSPVTFYVNFPPSLQVSTSGTVIAAGGSLTIYSGAADSDGSISLVQFYANGQLIGQSTTAPYSFTWTNVPAGIYNITVKATDNEGGVTTSSPISVTSALPPTVSITAPANATNIQSPANVTINATASSPNTGGSIAKVDFYENNGTATVKLGTSTTAPYSYVWTPPALGPYTLTAVATDNYGYTTTSTGVSIFVNQPPTMTVTASATNGVVPAGSGLSITSNIQDAVGQITDVQFFANGQLIGDVKSSPFNFNWTNPTPGTYQITVTASDNHGGVTTSAPITVTVAQPPVVAIAAPAAGTLIQAPANVVIQAHATTPNANGTIAKVDFYENNGTNTVKLGTSTSAPYSLTWSSPPVGAYTLTAVATDNYGFTTTSAAVGIFVNQPPTENVTTSATNGGVLAGSGLLITSNAQDALGQITGVQFFANGRLIGTVTSGPFNFNWSSLAPGTYQITVQATDNHGGVTTSAPITITIAQPPAVAITAPANNSNIQSPSNVTIQASASSPNANGSIAKVDFYADPGAGPTLVGEVTTAPYSFVWNQPATGPYTLTAVATDNYGYTTTSTPVGIFVNQPPTESVTTSASNGVVISSGSLLITSNAQDTLGTITNVQFFANGQLIGTVTSGPFNFNWSSLTPGTYQITVQATDNHGGVTTSAPITVTVDPPVPVISSAATTTGTTGAAFNYTITASNNPIGYSATGLPVGLSVNAGTGLISGTPTTGGIYTVVVDATNAGGTGLAILTLTINSSSSPIPARSIATGNNCTLLLKSDGTVWTAGYNGDGQLGNGGNADSVAYTKVPVLTGIVAVAEGNSFSLALAGNGTVWAWGYNGDGELANGTNNSSNVPVQVTMSGGAPLSGIVAVATGSAGGMALRNDGTVWTWGYNGDGELGNGNTTGSNTAVQVATATGSLSGVVAIACGSFHDLAVRSDGTVWAWGYDGDDELGDGIGMDSDVAIQVPGISGITSVAGGETYSLAVTNSGTIWAWGDESEGYLGNGVTSGNTMATGPVQVLNSTGDVLSGIVSVGSQGDHSLALTNLGTVWAWGENNYGQLGNGTVSTNSPFPVQVSNLSGVIALSAGYSANTVLESNGSIWGWGYNSDDSDYGAGGAAIPTAMPATVPNLPRITSIAAAKGHYLALDSSGSVWTWDDTTPGEISDRTTVTGSSTPARVSGLSGVTAIACGAYFNMALKSDGTVWAWGQNNFGQLGNGTTTSGSDTPTASQTPTQVIDGNGAALGNITAIACGAYSGMALDNTGTVWSWGRNDDGQLGNNSYSNSNVAAPIANLSGITSIAAGSWHVVACKSDGTVWAWGGNFFGELGNQSFSTGSNVPIQVSGLSGITAVAAGYYHSMALDNTGRIWSWGLNMDGELGNGTTTNSDAPAPVPSLSGMTLIQIGENAFHSVALKSDGTLWTWGSNTSGQLGIGTLGPVSGSGASPTGSSLPVQVLGLNGATVTGLACGKYSTLALTSTGTVLEWGDNSYEPYSFSVPIQIVAALPPAVSITTPASGSNIQSPSNVTIQAAASSPNTNGSIARVDFYENNGTSTIKLGTSATAPYSYTWVSPPVGPYTLTAVAIDNYGNATTSAEEGIFINQPPTENVTTSATGGVVLSSGSLLITSNAQDALGQITEVQFYANGQLIGDVTSGPFNFNWSSLTPGTYQITVVAIDNHGGKTTSSPISITVNQAVLNTAPTVSITSPTDGTKIQNPASISLQATAASTNPNGSIAKIDFFADSGSGPTQIGEITQAPYNYTWNQPAVGTYTLTAVATDNLGLATTSAPVHIQVFGWNTLTEGTSFLNEQTYAITIPNSPQVLAVSFRNLNFDTSALNQNKDAFEVALVDSTGKPLASTIASGRDSFFNVSEVGTPAQAQGVASATANGITTVYLNISQIPAGTQAMVIARLVNNDTDKATTVQVGQLVNFQATMPTAQLQVDPAENLPATPLDFSTLSNLTSDFAEHFDRSSFNDQANIYYVRVAEQNIGQYLFKGNLAAVIDQISDPSVTVANQDGYNQTGYPYFDFTASLNGGSLSTLGSSQERTIAFNNPNHIQFTYHITIMGNSENHPPVFTMTPNLNAYWYLAYSSQTQATDPDGDTVTYSILSGPSGATTNNSPGRPIINSSPLTINSSTGVLSWTPVGPDPDFPSAPYTPAGRYLVTIEANDGRGGIATQTFNLTLHSSNFFGAPPVFTSFPVVDAVAGQPYQYVATATDPNGNALTYSVVSGPAGLTINAKTGLVLWTPTAAQVGTNSVTLQAIGFATVTQSFKILVAAQTPSAGSSANTAPIFLQPTLINYEGLNFTPNNYVASAAPGVGNLIQPGVDVLGNVPFTIPTGENTWDAKVPGPGSGTVTLDLYTSIPDASEVDTLINTSWGQYGPNVYAYVEFFGSNGAYYEKPLVGGVDIRDFNNGIFDNTITSPNTVQVLSGISQYNEPDRLDKQSIALPAAFQNQRLVHVRFTDNGVGGGFQRIFMTGISALGPIQTGGAALQAGLPFSYDFIAQDTNNDPITYGATNLPPGATIDPTTGTFNWTPSQAGPYSVVFTATNSTGTSQLPFTFYVTGAVSDYPPAITSSPRTQIGFGNPYYYIVQATNPNGNPLTYSLTQAPAGMTISPGGYVLWTPTSAQLGANPVTIQVSDGRSPAVTQSFTINVLGFNPNSSPVITSPAVTGAVVNHLYSYNVQATDPDNDSLVYTLTQAPPGMSINAFLGTIRWTPASDQFGAQTVTVQVNDSYGGLTTQTFTVNVRGIDVPPIITSVPGTQAALNSTYAYQVVAQDVAGDPITYSLVNPPSGMTIDPGSGLIQWSNTGAYQISFPVEVTATDPYGGQAIQNFTIQVSSSSATSPVTFTTSPPFGVTPGGTYNVTLSPNNPSGGALTYTLVGKPTGMTINSSTGQILWTAPTTTGTYPVTIQVVSAGGGGTAILSYSITVAPLRPPSINSIPVTQTYANGPYAYAIMALDPAGSPMTYAVTHGPAGMTVDANGNVSWAVPANASGTYPVTVQVTDTYGNVATQSYSLAVTVDATPPSVTIISTINVVKIGNKVGLQVVAGDTLPITNIVLTQDGTPLVLDRNNIVYVTFSTSGIYSFTATVTDQVGNVGAKTITIHAIDPSSSDFPNVVVDQTNLQALNGVITVPTPIIATVQDPKLYTYQVQIAPTSQIDPNNVAADSPAYRTLAQGTTNVNDAQVATLDPTVLANGSYFIRVIAMNIDGNTNAQGVILTVESQNKPGRFFYSTTDLNIPLAGIPIQITRSYDSLNAGQSGDFGFGWSLTGQEAQVQTSVPPEQGAPSFFATAGSSFRVGSTVSITVPSGKRETFRFVPQPANLGISGLPSGFGFFGATYHAAYQPEQGVYDQLTSDQTVLSVGSDGSVGGYLLNTAYDPTDFYLTTKDGHVYHYNTTNGLEDEHDRNGVSLTYTNNGVTSSTGAKIAYTRDPATNRITAITDPSGKQIAYAYDTNGNLISVTDQAGRKTQYTYLTTPAHYLNTLVDANGNPIAKTAYDASGRLSTFTDALGNITTFLYDPVNLIQTKVEPLDPTTGQHPAVVTFYDAQGNVIQVTNEIGNVSTTTYDANNNPLVVTPPCGCKTTYTYDAHGNQLTKTDPLGNVTTSTYDALNDLTSVTDPLGHKTAYAYDANGNLTSVTDPLGKVTQLTNDSLGRPVALTDALGHTTQFTYVNDPTTGIAASKPSVVTRPDGSRLQFTYNSFGSVTSATDENGNKTQLLTDSGGILQQRIEADGATTQYGYDGNGNLTSVTDALGKITQMKYDAAFHLVERDGPNGEVTKFTYDQMGRLSSKIDPLNRTTTRGYRADGVLASITQPDNTVIAFDNDVNGRRTGVTDPDGNHTTFAYNGNSQVLSQTDPLGKITQYTYDGAGNLSSVMDRLGRVRQFAYNTNNQLTMETWLASMTATSPVKTITTSYDANGEVINTADDTGALAAQYDSRNRLQTLTTNYTGQAAFILNYGYDLGSRVTSVTDGDGVQVGTAYNQRNQVSQITWQGTGIAARANFTHDPLGDLTNIKRYADTAGTNLIGQTSYSYARNLPSIGYQAAAFNAAGDQTQTAGFAQTEAFGPLQNDADTNGLLTTGTQPLSRLGGVTHQDGNGNTLLSEGYANDQAGQLTGKTVGSDTATYGYDSTGQLLGATHSANTSANESYAYDQAGNRTMTGTQTSPNTVSANNRITADATYTYAYDDEGNLVTKTETATGKVWIYSYDLRNRLTNAVQTDSGNNMLSQASYVYDVLDRRIAKNVNGSTTAFFYEGDNLWKSIDASANVTRYLTGGAIDQWLARANSTGVNWYLTDRLGSVTGITDATGALINSTTYDSYGRILSQSNPTVADQLGFTGREYDSETGLYYFRARYYNPDLGRFQSEDPIGDKILYAKQTQALDPFTALEAAGSSSDGSPNATSEMQATPFAAGDFNLSKYVTNSPLCSVDPSGLDEYFTITAAEVGTEDGVIGARITAVGESGQTYVYDISQPNEAGLVNIYLKIINSLERGVLPAGKDFDP